jgi:diketogulonate reductase-like aldo/keto reductase
MVEQILDYALPIGYRLFDTAPLYRTEEHLGTTLAKFMKRDGIRREDVFITTKVFNSSYIFD